MSDFDDNLEDGKLGESQIAGYFKKKGFNILPVYEVQKGQYKGPSVYAVDGGNIVAPDMLIFGKGRTAWVEAKHKSAFTWYQIGGCWETGIDLHHYHEYLRVSDLSDWPVWLMFLHRDGRPAPNSPGLSPTGLYGHNLEFLSKEKNISHIYDKSYGHQKHGMIYWNKDSLHKLSEYPL